MMTQSGLRSHLYAPILWWLWFGVLGPFQHYLSHNETLKSVIMLGSVHGSAEQSWAKFRGKWDSNPRPEVLKNIFHAQLSWTWNYPANKSQTSNNCKFFLVKDSWEGKHSLLINMKMPTIVGIFIFISRKNFTLSWVEHEKKITTSGPGPRDPKSGSLTTQPLALCGVPQMCSIMSHDMPVTSVISSVSSAEFRFLLAVYSAYFDAFDFWLSWLGNMNVIFRNFLLLPNRALPLDSLLRRADLIGWISSSSKIARHLNRVM